MCFCLVLWRVDSDYRFYKHQRDFSQKLEKCKGIVNWEKFQRYFEGIEEDDFYSIRWKIFSSSLIYPGLKNVKSVITPSVSECVKGCEDWKRGKKRCKLRCEKRQSRFLFQIEKLHKTRFFDMSKLLENMANNISQCES